MPAITDCSVIRDRIRKVREHMKEEGVTIVVVTSDDYHQSEYSGEFFELRKYLSGFTGSAGTLVIGEEKAALFTDGRYFVQAALQLEGTGIDLCRQGQAGVPTVSEYLAGEMEAIRSDGRVPVLGFDGRTVAAGVGRYWAKIAVGGRVVDEFDAAAGIWMNRPEFPHSELFVLDERYAGESAGSKLSRIRKAMTKAGADVHLIASLDDIAWVLNLRGADVECNPVFMAYLLIFEDHATLFVNNEAVNPTVRGYLKDAQVEVVPYEEFENRLQQLAVENHTFFIDEKRVNYKIFNILTSAQGKSGSRVVTGQNPSVLLKAIKNETEIKNLQEVHVEDGLAVFDFMYWLKEKMKAVALGLEEPITEVDAYEYLDRRRSEISDFIELSFPTISASGANAAQLHYAATKENCSVLKPEGMLLVDSGGQYLRGTTDITRTFALGEVTDEMKKFFTLTLKGMLNLGYAKFLKGIDGFGLDILARGPLWEEGVDYRCGTGHGIGYLLNVHESPNAFRWKRIPGVNDCAVMEEGMVTSDEPGVYVDGKFGIRIENEILCEKDLENEYGTFLKFSWLTLVPIDRELIDVQFLSKVDIDRLNRYHELVFRALSPFVSGEKLEYLSEVTAPLEA